MPNDLLLNQALRAGSAAFELGDWGTALKCGRTAVALAPGHAGAHSLLGLALLQLGEITPAVAALEQAVARDKNNAALLGNLAQAYTVAERHADAHQTFRRAQRLAPAHWHYAQGAAVALAHQGKPAEAEPLLRRLVERHPREAALWYNLGNVQLDLGKSADAEQSLRTVLRLAPDDHDALLNLGSALHRQSRFSSAATIYRQCLAARQGWIPPHLNLISVLIDDGRFSEAEKECILLLEHAPDLPEAYRFLGAAYAHQGKQLQALGAYRRAAERAPGDLLSQQSYGGALAECGQLHTALRVLARTESLSPESETMPQLRSMFELAHGLFSDGWTSYRRRPSYLLLSRKWADARLEQELPDDLKNKHILVRREQGLGDELFFFRHLPLLKARGARITVCASIKIAALIVRTGIADAVVPDGEPLPDDIDIQLLCGDLPHALQPCAASPRPWRELPCTLRDYRFRINVHYPPPVPSLRIPALPEAIARMRDRLHQLGPPPYAAVTWRAGTAASEQRGADWVLSKEVPITALGAALRHTPATLIALQRHPLPGEIDALASACGRPIADMTACNESLEDMLALLDLIDDYIGVSNTNMHLRAATGRSARVLVPNPAEWRWMYSGNRTPWFPAFRIYRQSMQGEWSDALAQLAHDFGVGA